MTAKEIRKAELDYQRSARRTEVLRAQRNETVALALSTGWTQAGIAKATGLTRGRIHQIVKPSGGGLS